MNEQLRTRLLTYMLISLIAAMLLLFPGLVVKEGLKQHALSSDYTSFLLAGTLIAQGHAPATQLYDVNLQRQVEQSIQAAGSVTPTADLLPFLNPPLVAALALPLNYLSPALGNLLWGGLQFLVLLLALWLLAPMLPTERRYLLWLGAFAYLPVYQSLIQAQLSPTLLLGIVLFWRCLRAGRSADVGAGASLALLLLKPQALPLYLLYLLYRRNWRALGSFTAVAVAIYLLSAAVSGLDWPFAYLKMIAQLGSRPDLYNSYPQLMFTWRGLLARFDITSIVPLAALTILTVAAVLYAWWRSDRAVLVPDRAADRLALQLGAATVAATLDGFYLYNHDLTMLIFSGAALLGWAAQHNWPSWVTALLVAALITPFTFFANIRDVLGPPLDTSFIVVMVVALGALLYLLLQPPLAQSAAAPNP